MARIDNVRRIIVEEFPEESRETVSRLAGVLNLFMEQVVDTINGRIDFDNTVEDVIQITLEVDANGVPIGNNKVRSTLGRIRGTTVLRAIPQDNPANLATGQPFISYSQQEANILTVDRVTGLVANETYLLIIRLIP